MINVNLVPVLIAAIASMIVGFVWYGPLFGKPWMKLMGMSKPPKMDSNMQKTYAISFLGSVVMAYVLSMLISLMPKVSVVDGIMAGFWTWLGFVAPVMMTEVLYGKKSWSLYYINAGYQLVVLLVMGAVLVLV